MHIVLRAVISMGLIITALTILNVKYTQGLITNDEQNAYLDRCFNTTCFILCTSIYY